MTPMTGLNLEIQIGKMSISLSLIFVVVSLARFHCPLLHDFHPGVLVLKYSCEGMEGVRRWVKRSEGGEE